MHAEVCVIIIVLTICTPTQSARTYMLNALHSNKIIVYNKFFSHWLLQDDVKEDLPLLA